MDANRLDRIGLVVHPRRELGRALATVREWAERDGAELVQLDAPGQEQQVAARGEVADCDVVVALGGDGTALAALRVAAPAGVPVLGVACGSLGALTPVTAEDFDDALTRVARDDWDQRRLPALVIDRDGEERVTAINDLVLVRARAGQGLAEVAVDGERFIRFAGDGLVLGTPLGSTAYTLAAGGPMLAPRASGVVMKPPAPHPGGWPPPPRGASPPRPSRDRRAASRFASPPATAAPASSSTGRSTASSSRGAPPRSPSGSRRERPCSSRSAIASP